MKEIDDLLNKYFEGKTTLEEENYLKSYFRNEEIQPEHEVYKTLFHVFDEKAKEKIPQPVDEKNAQPNVKRFWKLTAVITGIAAAFLMIIWVMPIEKNQDFAIVNGEKIENTQFAQNYALEKLNNVSYKLETNLKPLEAIATVKSRMEPVKKIPEIKKRMEKIEETIHLNN
ncbi:MAG: hypothetical protein KBG33_00835 [Paludibacteraceae bacterium]|jgi:hypothetical protein|nr:hypothetical protein [Paludibacteraceae bacterium]